MSTFVQANEKLIKCIESGNHICTIYKTEKEKFSSMIAFFKVRLNKNYKCLCITGEHSREETLSALREGGIDVEKYLDQQLMVVTQEETYLKNKPFNREDIIALLREAEQKALEEGFSGLSVAGEASSVCTEPEACKEFLEYEAKLNGIFPMSKTVALCQYNENTLPPEVLVEAIHCHPDIILYGVPRENFFFNPSTSFTSKERFDSGSYTLIRDGLLEEQ